MACHPEPALSPKQRAEVLEMIRASVRHCSLCGTSPISRVVACTDVDCPAREVQSA